MEQQDYFEAKLQSACLLTMLLRHNLGLTSGSQGLDIPIFTNLMIEKRQKSVNKMNDEDVDNTAMKAHPELDPFGIGDQSMDDKEFFNNFNQVDDGHKSVISSVIRVFWNHLFDQKIQYGLNIL